MAVSKSQQKDINLVLKKYPDRCSICKDHFEDGDITYTVFGYDKLQRMQIVSGCCVDRISRPILLGLCGEFDPNDLDELMEDHPFANQFFKK